MATTNELVTKGLIQLQLEGKGVDDAVARMKEIVANANAGAKGIEGIGTAAKTASGDVGFLGKQFESIGQTILGTFAAIKVASFLKDSFLELAHVERAWNTLRVQIEALGVSAAGSFPAVKEFIHALGEQTGQLDTALIPAMNRLLLTFDNVRASQELLRISAIYARAGFGDLESNATKLSVAFQTGLSKSLRGFGIELKDANGKALDLGDSFQKISDKAEILAKTSLDSQARVDAFGRAMESSKLKLGVWAENVFGFLDKMEVKAEGLSLKLTNLITGGRQTEPLAADDTPTMGERKALTKEELSAIEAARKRAKELATAAAKEAADKAVEEEKKRAKELADFTLKVDEETIRAQIALTKEGTFERYELELQLLERQQKAAIATAESIKGANVERVRELYGKLNDALVGKFSPKDTSKEAMDEWNKITQEFLAFARESNQARLDAAKLLQKDLLDVDKVGMEQRRRADLAFIRSLLKEETGITVDDIKQRLRDKANAEIAADAAAHQRLIASKTLDADAVAKLENALAKKVEAIHRDEADAEVKIARLANLQKAETALGYAQVISGALAQAFSSNQDFAAASAIINTALAITQIWADPTTSNYWVKLAESVALGIAGAAQVDQILSTHIGSGGSVLIPGGAGGGSTASVAPPSPAQISVPIQSTASGSSSSSSSGSSSSVTVNAGVIVADDRTLAALARKIQRATRYDPGRFQ